MSRLAVSEWSKIPARLETEGLYRLRKRDADDIHRNKRFIKRSWGLVIPPLRKLFCDLANKLEPWPLYLHGPTGHGKTAAVLAFCDRVAGARYWDVETVMEQIQTDPPWHYWHVELAVLDEIGAVRTGEGRNFDYECVKRFYEWRQDRPTIYVSNQPLSVIAQLYDARLFSRLSSGTQYRLVDRDRRLREE